MPRDENAVIRYLMDEMDPSEEVLMEREMMEDDDLLIEVESLRQTMQRLDDLPEKEPPAELTDSIIEQAAEEQRKWFHFPSVPVQAYKYAAVLLLGMGLSSGAWLIYGSSNVSGSESAEKASFEVSLPSSMQTASTKNTEVEPWVDHNDVIYFQDRFNTNSSDYEAIIEASMQKLTPLTTPPHLSPNSTNLHLTGAQQ